MELENIFKRNTETSELFIANRETGRWALTKDKNWSDNKKLLNYLSKPKPSPEQDTTDLIVLNTTNKCNLACKYCFVGEPEEKKDLKPEVGKKVVDEVLKLKKSKRPHIVFHGREPLLNFEGIKEIVRYGKEQDPSLNFSIQSNTTIINDEILDFLSEYNLPISTSLDGLKENHNKTRPYKNGEGTYEDIIKNMKKLREKGIQDEHSINLTINKENVEDLHDILDSYKNSNVSSIQFSTVNPLGNARKNRELVPSPKAVLKNMKECFDSLIDSYLEGEGAPIRLKNLPMNLSLFFKKSNVDNCLRCGNNLNKQPLIAVDLNGEAYPCDYFFGQEDYKVGNIKEKTLKELINSKDNFRNYREVDQIEECSDCDWKNFCGGGCPANSFAVHNDLNHKSYYCEYSKGILEYMAKKLPLLHKEGLIGKILNSE